jgi:hypothetical protein
MSSVELRRGDIVEVRSPAEILATLDENGMLDKLPFMPEMVAYCGKKFAVHARTEKICDTIKLTGSRKLPNTVLLGELRCDGAAHGGCQAECRPYWKEAWLRKVGPESSVHAQEASSEDLAALTARTSRNLVQMVDSEGRKEERWSCQATQLLECATERLGTFDPRPYIHEYTCGNVSFARLVKVGVRAAVEEPLRKFGLMPQVFLKGTQDKTKAEEPLNLQPGEWVQVKSKEEIAATLNTTGHNRGLWFDREMIAYCGGVYKVRRRIGRFIDDYRDGRMVVLKTEAVTLESVWCTGDLSQRRWFCPRNAIPYWRECWLRRAEQP